MTKPPRSDARLGRRGLLMAGAASLATTLVPWDVQAHALLGPVSPREAVPAGLRLSPTVGKPALLKDLLIGRITAVQLMFTGCSATCPIQGAIFADAQSHLMRADRNFRLLSISIDPLSDDAPALTRWLGQFGAQPARWSAAAPRVQDVDVLLDFLRGRASGADRHTAQAFLFDRQARLAFRTPDMPPGRDLALLMAELAATR